MIAFPWADLRRVLRPEREMESQLADYTARFRAGRDAVYWAVRGLMLAPETPVWMPSFHCGVEVRAVLDAGHPARFYRVGGDLCVDEEDLAEKVLAQPGPVFAIHYFGVAQPGIERIASLCRRVGVPLIEDCAHALFSRHGRRLLGSHGSISIFSLRKTLGIYDGGALRIDERRCLEWTGRPFKRPPRGSCRMSPYMAALADHAGRLLGTRAAGISRRRQFRRAGRAPDTLDRVEEKQVSGFGIRDYNVRMSWISTRLAAGEVADRIVARRRENWKRLDEALCDGHGECRLIPYLPDGSCPLALPIQVGFRPALRRRLAEAGIQPYIFGAEVHPALRGKEFAETERLRREVLCLPVHQELSSRQMDYIAEVAVRCLRICEAESEAT